MKTKSALSYFGSDSEVARNLASLLDHCRHVTIPFVGGAAIIPHLRARAIVANDKHELAINFYRVMSGRWGSDNLKTLVAMCESTLSHPAEMAEAQRILDADSLFSAVERAWAFWACCWIGRKGKGGTRNQGGLPSVRRTANGGTNATRIIAAARDLHIWAEQFKRCEWQNVCFSELLPQVADRPDCGIYCDPPWVGVGANYLHTFSDHDHWLLAECISRFEKTTVVIRYGDDPMIRDFYEPLIGWRIIEASSRDQCNAMKGEIWITNRSGADGE